VSENDLVARLIQLRHEAKLSQAALAARLGVTAASIAFYETRRRRVPLEMAARWAEACGAELQHILVRPGELVEAALPDDERRLLHAYRRLHPGNQQLVADFARGLINGSPQLRDAIAVQVPLLLASCPSDVEEQDHAKTVGKTTK
jgi:transcriptional regulator with XRE-family HTH domain